MRGVGFIKIGGENSRNETSRNPKSSFSFVRKALSQANRFSPSKSRIPFITGGDKLFPSDPCNSPSPLPLQGERAGGETGQEKVRHSIFCPA
jgi:hypothetical protein